MDQPALWLSSSFAAAKLVVALWCAQLSLASLDARRTTLGWQILLAAAAIAASLWALSTPQVPVWWRPAWLVNAILSAAALIDCVRRWVSAPSGQLETWRVHGALGWIGLTITMAATSAAVIMRLPSGWLLKTAAALDVISCAGLLGLTIAATLELTFGALGTALLRLRWTTIARWTTACWSVQLLLGVYIILSQQAAETPMQTAAPFLFAFGMMIVGYIVWCIPRRMLSLATRGEMQGHVSLAVAAWLAVVCLVLACVLPPAWPWRQLGSSSAGILSLAIVEQ